MKSLSNYIKSDKSSLISLSEKLLINKNFKSAIDTISVPKGTHISGEEDYDMVIKTIKHYNDKDFNDKIDKIFDDIHCESFKYCFYDKVNDDENDYKKSFGKIFPNGLRNYKPVEYINFELNDDECPDNWDDYNSLAKFETYNGNYIIVWTAIDSRLTTMYAFISKL